MTRTRNLLLAALAAILAVNLVLGYRVYSAEASKAGEDQAFEKISVMMRVLYLIRKDYVDADKISYKDLVYNALHGMVRSLDPFSDFMSPDQYRNMMETTEGEFGGLGVIVSAEEDTLTIIAPIDGTPGSRAGLQAGDQIVKIQGKNVAGMKLGDAVKLMRGKPGTMVTITVHRPSTGVTKDYTIERAIIPVHSVKDTKVLPGTSIGYVRVTQFAEPTAGEFQTALKDLSAKNIDALVIDLRNNPGGLLPTVVEMCSYFLEPGKLIVSTEGRRPSQKHEFRTRKRGYHFKNCPIAILINGGSASASEIMSGCLKDWGRAVLIGEKSFGKGSVQNIIPLPDGSALRLTTAMYYTPSRRRIHRHGIEPDIKVKLTREEYQAIFDAQDRGGESAPDAQLQRAVEVLNSYDIYRKAAKSRFSELRQDPSGSSPEKQQNRTKPPAEKQP